ncbi:hypothetical protein DSL72_002084 [Monilinia vaccinii-corymbosi]|uniref:Uncharacterized protein n=1 Tax=Monilinia vaccinii-corymbosi TaxID=61207 RepID=A0A8A3PBL6_9HELO|nr:hypothetical protein DSL72_002084 [Monilinia vaccinii-corymbosi]
MEELDEFDELMANQRGRRKQHIHRFLEPVFNNPMVSYMHLDKKMDHISGQVNEILNLYKFLAERVEDLGFKIPREVVRRHGLNDEPLIHAISNFQDVVVGTQNDIRLVNGNVVLGLKRLGVVYSKTVNVENNTKHLVDDIDSISEDLKANIDVTNNLITKTNGTRLKLDSVAKTATLTSEDVKKITSVANEHLDISKLVSTSTTELLHTGEKIIIDRVTINNTLPSILKKVNTLETQLPAIQTSIDDRTLIDQTLPSILEKVNTFETQLLAIQTSLSGLTTIDQTLSTVLDKVNSIDVAIPGFETKSNTGFNELSEQLSYTQMSILESLSEAEVGSMDHTSNGVNVTSLKMDARCREIKAFWRAKWLSYRSSKERVQ